MPHTITTADLPLSSLQMEVRNVQRAAAAASDAITPNAGGTAATFELVFTTGAAVKRYDWVNDRYYLEQLQVSAEAIDLSRLQRGAPLLNSHWAYTLEDQIGVVDQPSIEGGQGLCAAQLSRRDSVRGVVQDLEDRVIRNVSVGYARNAVEMVAPSEANGMWVYNVTRWTPMEVSLVPIPADMDCQVRSADGRLPDGRVLRTFPCQMALATTEQRAAVQTSAQQPTQTTAAVANAETLLTQGATMADTQQNGSGNPAAATDDAASRNAATTQAADAARAAGVQAERTRQADIRTAAEAARSTLGEADATALATRLIDAGTTVEEARREVLASLAARSAATTVRGAASLSTVADEVDVTRARMVDALTLRARPGITRLGEHTLDVAGARNFRGMDLLDMARACVRQAGGNPDGLSRRELALASLNLDSDASRAAGMHGTSDFPNILANTVNRSMAVAYQQAPRTFVGWTRRSTARDFREKAVTQLSDLTQFLKVNEAGEYKQLTFGDSAEKYSLSKYGGIVAITWESLINDDMSAFDRIPMMIGEEAAATESDIVYGILSANAALSDTVALFEASTHKNYTSSGTAISDTSLGVARALMRKQTGPKGRTLNLTPDFLIVGPDKESEANKYTSAQFVAAKATDINPAYNTSLEVVVDSRISGNAWYMAAAPTRIDTIEYAYLEGEDGLFTERKQGFEVDGLMIKARHVFAAKAIDFRGLYKNVGA